MGATYQSSNVVNGKADGSKGRILVTGNSGRASSIEPRVIYPGPQGRGIRAESIILKNGWQTTARNPSTDLNASFGKTRVKR